LCRASCRPQSEPEDCSGFACIFPSCCASWQTTYRPPAQTRPACGRKFRLDETWSTTGISVLESVPLRLPLVNCTSWSKNRRRALRLNPLAVTLALLFWAWIWGAMGLILAVLIVGATKIICDYVDFQRGLGQWLGIDRLTIKLHSGHFPSPPLLGTPLMCYKPEHAQMDARTPEAP